MVSLLPALLQPVLSAYTSHKLLKLPETPKFHLLPESHVPFAFSLKTMTHNRTILLFLLVSQQKVLVVGFEFRILLAWDVSITCN